MEKSVSYTPRIDKIFLIIINVISGISILYYLFKIDHMLVGQDTISSVILVIFCVKFIVDLITFKIGFSSFSLILLFLPIVSLLGFGPIGEVQPLFNDRTQLIEKHFYVLAFAALFFYYVWSLLLLINQKTFKHFDAEALKYFYQGPKSLLATWIFSIIAIAASIIYLPDLPGRAYTDLSASLLPGNAWNAVVVVAYFFVLVGVKDSLLRKAALYFVPFWLLTHYARVDILGLVLIMYLIISNMKKGQWIKSKLNFKKLGLLGFGILIFSYLGIVRHSGLIIDLESILESVYLLFNYLTVQDLIYSTAAAIEVGQNYGNFHTLLNHIPQLIPSFFVDNPDGAPIVIASYIHTNFGLLLYGEYYMNYQLAGLIAAPFVTYLILFFPFIILRHLLGNFGIAVAYYLLVTATPRIMWYGYIYYLKPLVVILPVFLILYWLIFHVEKEFARKSMVKAKSLLS